MTSSSLDEDDSPDAPKVATPVDVVPALRCVRQLDTSLTVSSIAIAAYFSVVIVLVMQGRLAFASSANLNFLNQNTYDQKGCIGVAVFWPPTPSCDVIIT